MDSSTIEVKPIGSTENLELYDAADFKMAFQNAINAMKPPSVIDNAHIAARQAQYSHMTFSSDPDEDAKIRYEVVRNHLANDFWRMTESNHTEDPRVHITMADEALKRFMRGKKVKHEIQNPKLRINYERLGTFFQRTPSDDKILDGFAVSRNALTVKISGYKIPEDKNLEVQVIFDSKGPGGVVIIKANIEEHADGEKDYFVKELSPHSVSTRFAGGLRGVLQIISPDYVDEGLHTERARKGRQVVNVPVCEILTRVLMIPLSPVHVEIERINNLIYQESEEGTVKGVGMIHPHNMEDPAGLTGSKKMVADLLRDKSLRDHLSDDFHEFSRNISAQASIDAEEFQRYLSASDFLTIFSDLVFSVPGQEQTILFSAIAEIPEYGDTISGISVVDPTGMEMSEEEVVSHERIAQGARNAILEASKNKTFKIEDRQKAADVVEHYLRMKDITIDEMPFYVKTSSPIVPETQSFEKLVSEEAKLQSVVIPTPHTAADPKHASQLNTEYMEELRKWRALPLWKRIKKKKPEQPTGI